MDYYSIETMPTEDYSYCFLENGPRGTVLLSHRMAEGDPMGDEYPKDAIWQMRDDGGIKLPTLIANTDSFLIVQRPLMEIFKATGVSMECLPFTLLNHKKRVASRDYFIINVLGTFDCLNLKESDIEWEGKDVVHAYELVLDPRKLKEASPLFRVKESPRTTVMNEEVAESVRKLKPTNVYLTKLEQAP